jgi:cysteine desulfurase
MIFDLDANATYAPSERLQRVILDSWSKLGNPSSIHQSGQRARAALEEARDAVNSLVGATRRAHQTIFTSGATEANNTVVRAQASRPGPLVSSEIEHPCVLGPLKTLRRLGRAVVLVKPNASGQIDPLALTEHLTQDTALVSVMAANNETGVLNDIAQISSIVRSKAPHAIVHTDAAQMCGKLPVSFDQLGVDCMTISGHKFGALTGIGALIVRHSVHLEPLIEGGAQESKLRGGTENVIGIISLGHAAAEAHGELSARTDSMQRVRDRFETELLKSVAGVEVNGSSVPRLPNTSNIFVSGVRADDLLVALDLEGVTISGGAACSSGKPEPSHVLTAMAQTDERARSTVRVSFRADQPVDAASQIVSIFTRVIERIRSTNR